MKAIPKQAKPSIATHEENQMEVKKSPNNEKRQRNQS